MADFNLCIIKPNNDAFSETFIQEHINKLPGNKKVLYGGAFPVYDNEGKFLIRSKIGILIYLIQKRLFGQKNISIRTNALANYLRANKTDVVFAEYGMVGAMVTRACKLANVPLVIHFHGADAHHRPTVKTYYHLYQEAFAYASAIISVSADMVEALKNLGAPAHKIHLASCGVDPEAFPILDVLHTQKNFLSVGRFVEKKSPASVVKAFAIVVQNIPDAKLWMVGNGPLFQETKQLVSQLNLQDSVTLTGVLKPAEIRQVMRQVRCFVQHSVTTAEGDKEGTPVTILEAGSSGLPIVSTAHAGIKEAVINDETGYLVAEHDIDGMAHYMLKLAKNAELAAQMGKNGAQHIRQNFDTRNRINTLTQILHNAIKQN